MTPDLPNIEVLRDAVKSMEGRFDCPALWSDDWKTTLACASGYLTLLEKLGADRVRALMGGTDNDVDWPESKPGSGLQRLKDKRAAKDNQP